MRHPSTKIRFIIVIAILSSAQPAPSLPPALRPSTRDRPCRAVLASRNCTRCGRLVRRLFGRLFKPGLETRLPKSRILAGDECRIVHSYAVVARVWVSDDFAWILPRGQSPANEFIQRKLFRSADFNHAIHGRADRDLG